MSKTVTPVTPAAPVVALQVVLPGVVEPDGLEIRRTPLSPPGSGQVLVAVEATGMSFAEQSMRRGIYYRQPAFPFVPGYDLVGRVAVLGAGVDPGLLGRRIAALTKTGGWASHVLLAAEDVIAVPEGLDPVDVEALIVNGITAWQMLHRTARIRPGQTVLVHGANGGVGTILVQLARHHGVQVIGTASPRHHQALRALGVTPVDYRDPDLEARVRAIAPNGVDAVFDHLGGESVHRSYRLLAPGGTLVSYAIASKLNDRDGGRLLRLFLGLMTQLAWWNYLPNGHSASFYNIWSGRGLRPRAFRARLREDFTAVLGLLRDGALAPQIAARLPLTAAGEAMELAESHTAYGKIVLLPQGLPD
ncbi:medium chain dehydrogenase/reductase family protein [Streptacidiphilus cavernicola]|uniref:Medium chain dehydrogenase/reductase family protein n=1 Tax=Streptacidiphilus cavernicola TaxID=3342716 RepID=A0ABV6W1P8_9ACTN